MIQRIKVELTNRSAILEYPFPDEVRKAFSYHPKNYFFMPGYRSGSWDGLISPMRGSALPSGLFLAIRKEAEKAAMVRFVVKDHRRAPAFAPFPKSYTVTGFDIRPYQRDCVQAMIQASRTGGIVLNATGTGKTFIAGLYFRLLQEGFGVFVVDELTLMGQAQDELEKVLGEKVGVIGDQRFDPRRISVATIQTLHRHCESKPFKAWHKKLSVMMLDELHQALNRRSLETVRAMKPLASFGLTATLAVEKDHIYFPATALCGPEIFRFDYKAGLKRKVLTPGICVGVDLVREIRMRDSDGEDASSYGADYESRISESKRYNDVIEGLAREAIKQGHAVAILVERIPHLMGLSARLSDIPHQIACGMVKAAQRRKALKRFDAGKIQLLIANRVFKKGINLKRLSCIIDGAGMSNPNDARQKYGRGVRLCSQKEGLIYFDIGDRRPMKRKGSQNRFARATNARRRSLESMGVPILKLRAKEGAEVILAKASKFLQKHLARFEETL